MAWTAAAAASTTNRTGITATAATAKFASILVQYSTTTNTYIHPLTTHQRHLQAASFLRRVMPPFKIERVYTTALAYVLRQQTSRNRNLQHELGLQRVHIYSKTKMPNVRRFSSHVHPASDPTTTNAFIHSLKQHYQFPSRAHSKVMLSSNNIGTEYRPRSP